MGMIPPSATPMSNRAPSIVTNDTANPDPNEHTENASVASTSNCFRDPNRSEITPIPNAATAHVSDNALASTPTCVLLNFNSG